jgi:hypothetical protein
MISREQVVITKPRNSPRSAPSWGPVNINPAPRGESRSTQSYLLILMTDQSPSAFVPYSGLPVLGIPTRSVSQRHAAVGGKKVQVIYAHGGSSARRTSH